MGAAESGTLSIFILPKGGWIMETLWDGGPVLQQASGVFPMGTDSVLLADFARPGPRATVLDLGTGSGILPILLLYARPGLSASAVELEETACRLAKSNFAANGLSERIQLISGDLRQYRALLPAGGFDLTVSNPPYFGSGAGREAAYGLKNARGDGTCTLEDLCSAAAWATRWGGSFCLVFRPERMGELFYALRDSGFEPKRLRPVHHGPGDPVNLILLEARRGGKPGLLWEKDLYLRTHKGQETQEIRRIYRRDHQTKEGKEQTPCPVL
jgi:tRNA1(Val) A37 N6-methylase TrmN6